MGQPLRCRMGFHKWVQIRRTDPDLDNPAQSVEWDTTCRDCGRAADSGIGVSLLLVGTVAITGVAVFWLWSPLLGAVIMIGALGGLGWSMAPASISRIARWLSSGR